LKNSYFNYYFLIFISLFNFYNKKFFNLKKMTTDLSSSKIRAEIGAAAHWTWGYAGERIFIEQKNI